MKLKKSFYLNMIYLPFFYTPLYSFLIVIEKVITALIPMLKVLCMSAVIDAVIQISEGNKKSISIFGPLIVWVILIAYDIVNDKIMNFVVIKMKNVFRSTYQIDIMDKEANLKYLYYEDSDIKDLLFRVCDSAEDKITESFLNVVSLGELTIKVIGIISILFYQVWWAAILILLVSIPLLVVSAKGGKKEYDIQREVTENKRRAEYLHELLMQRETAKERILFNYSKEINKRWKEQYEYAQAEEVKVHKKWFVRMNAGGLVTVLVSIFVMGVLLSPLIQGIITVGMYISLSTSLGNLAQMMSWQLTSKLDLLNKSKEYIIDLCVFNSLDEEEGNDDIPLYSSFNFKKIEFKNVSFTYPNTDKQILNDVSFILEKGKHYAFVGTNGAGKTTIIKLLSGLYNDFDGDIFIDGRSIKKMSAWEKKSLCAIVYQDFGRYSISLRDNILIGDVRNCQSNIGEKKLSVISKALELDSIVQKLPNGLQTDLGKISKEGMDLSGGEWQRIAMARAMISDASLLILDEPTSALDPIMESNLYHEIEQMTRHRTTIFISHRLASIKLADEIMVLENGKIFEQGTHAELMKKKGLYYSMYDKQRSWYQ